jgi:hypothetical protein
MIQIQDDIVSQSASPTSSVAQGVQASQPISQSAPQLSPQKDNTAEIDQLLAELDKLSKNFEEKSAPVKSEVVSQAAPVQAEPIKAESIKNDDKSAEKFDFDSFLTDLESKIDAESNKNKPAEFQELADPQKSDEFRKNRPALDVQSTDEEVKEDVAVSDEANEEELKSQNIFTMLGLMNITDEEKNQFLDELEAMIWDDFVVHDLELLLTSEEYTGARKILDNADINKDEVKENLIVYLEKLIPDLDEVLYDKALELKSEMMGERLGKMKESADEAVLAKVKEVENLISQNLWKSASLLLNQLS